MIGFKGKGHNRGAAMIETLFVFPVVMFLGFAIVHVGFIYQAKTNLEYAALMGARIAAVSDLSDPSSFVKIRNEIRERMKAFDPTENPVDSVDESSKVLIRIVRPNRQIFTDWGRAADSCPSGLCRIPNDNLLYRDASRKNNVSIQEANILKIEVSYKVDTKVPFMRELFKVDNAADMFLPEAEANPDFGTPGIWVTTDAVVRMQTDPAVSGATNTFFDGYP
ncbi:hypothetical protein A9Q81_24415 [Gammaproteobacteria bacterium 42_54_T18]|nr:hypothetical protein A9Q81_24415 [Gammaproteobacteria bacterium 42_54_T18]